METAAQHICTHTHTTEMLVVNGLNRYDPTRTASISNAFVHDLDRRFVDLCKLIRQAIVDQDCFGLVKQEQITTYAVSSGGRKDMGLPGPKAFQFMTSQDKVTAFMDWIKEQSDKGILQVRQVRQLGEAANQAWTDKYIEDTYKRGVIRARYEMKKAGFPIPSLEKTGGIQASMNLPMHMDRVGLLYTRTFQELKGVTASMDSQLSRILAQGMADGDGPRDMARKLVNTIQGPTGELGITDKLGRFIPAKRRAEIIARTEVIRAHHAATIQEYRNYAVAGVRVQAEFATAGDGRVCPKCASLQGKIYTLDEIENLIPVHPQCRCIALPTMPEGTKVDNTPLEEGIGTVEWKSTGVDRSNIDITKDKDILEILSNPLDRFVLTEGSSQTRADGWLEKLAKLQGFDKKPTLFSKAEFDKLEGDIIYRGTCKSEFVTQFKTGEYFGGTGMFGSGMYAVAGGDPGWAFRTAEDYALKNKDNVIQFKLKKGVRIIDYNDINKMVWEELANQEGPASYSKLTAAVKNGVLTEVEVGNWSRLEVMLKDPGRFAMLKGYDVIRIPNVEVNNGTFYIVLNRTALNVLK